MKRSTLHPPSPTSLAPNRRTARRRFLRRSLLALGGLPFAAASPVLPAAAAATVASPATAEGDDLTFPNAGLESRMAFLLGNRSYPQPFDLPPVAKNMRDLHEVLALRGFDVTNAMDQDLKASRAAMDRFVERASRAPADTTLFFYFVGHGVQVDAANLLLPAGQNPAAHQDVLRSGSMQLLGDVVARLPERKGGMIMAVVDACRTTLKASDDSESGLNQVEAPPGCLIAFSTGAGKPAIAPAVETQNTFYTASLVRLMASLSDETSFPDMFQLVRTDVRTVMSNHPVEAIRRLAQDPFVADHSGVRLALAPRTGKTDGRRDAFSSADEERSWAALMVTAWPPDVLKAAEGFLAQYPSSRYAPAATVARDGARVASEALQRNDVHIYRAAFQLPDETDAERREDVLRAGRGDKDAAARMGRRYREASKAGGASASRYEGWMQYAAALGNGIAGYELALFYRRQNQPLPASQFEARARALGYTPPPTLDNVRK